jgi:GT2 family glycosyltransferase/glycosyltransferase involved in cell wall biosynthesis
MLFDGLILNFRKVIKILRYDGLKALFRVIQYKQVIALNWRLGNIFRKLYFMTQNLQGMDRHKLVLFTGVPYDDIGGGQRSAQLTRAAIRTGIQVLYVYIYPKYDVNKHTNVISKIKVPNLFHKNIKDMTVKDFLKFIHEDTKVVFEIPHPLFVEYLEIARIRGVRTIFELIDDWSTSLGGDWFKDDVFQKFVLQTDIVIGTSKLLIKKLGEMGRNEAIYLPNAANEYIFDNNNIYKRPSGLPEGSVALYIGSLYGEWFGWEYIREAADKNPDIDFCLIGNKPSDIPVLLSENVHFLGEKKIDELPAYLSSAEFCLLPFKSSQLTDAISPIKVFEYLFMSKPVVSSYMAEVKDFSYVFTAQNETEFARQCQNLKNEKTEINISKSTIEEFIFQNSWFLRLQNIMDIKGHENISVIILIHNNRNIIRRCLKSLFENCSSYLADVVVVDNASEDGGGEYVLENFPKVRLIRNPLNGCSSGRNLGVQNSHGKYLAFFDSDQWFTGGFCFEEALSILESHAEIGAVGWTAGWLDLTSENLDGAVVDYFPNRAMNAKAAVTGYRTDVTYLGTGGLFIPRTVFEATGGFDIAYDPTSFEDTDLSFAIKRLGFKIAYRDLTCVRHEAHQTTTSSENSPEYQKLYSRNSQYLLKKWEDHRHFFEKYKI